MQDESDADGADRRRRSVPLFDPVAGMRAMADVQAEGLRAASDLLERLLTPEEHGPGARSVPPQPDYAPLVDAWAQLLERVASGLARPGESGSVTVPIDSSGVGPSLRLVLERGERGASADAEVWLHNGTAAPAGPLALRCGALTAPDGEVLEAAVGFEPAQIASLPPRSSRGVVVTVAVDGRPSPGIYRGTIQADGAPTLWLPVEVAVEPC